jgi:ABC-type branched-subunit amino acid transport system permease subunit
MKTSKSLRLPVPGLAGQSRRAKVILNVLKILGLLALLVIALIFPQQISPDEATTTIAVYTLMFAAWATSWNTFAGYTGYIALGHATFFGSGAYALGLMCQHWHIGNELIGEGSGGDISLLFVHISADYAPFVLVPLAGLVAGILAVPIGWIALRTRRHTFIVVTIAIFFIFQLLAFNLRGITNGSTGLGFPYPSWRYPFYNYPFYYVMLAILLLALGVSWWVRHSKYGLGLLAIRDDEDRALGLGVKTEASKLIAFAVSAIFAGMLGAVWGYFNNSVFPAFAFNPLDDIAVALMGFMGGLGTLSGPIIGALILEPTQQYFTVNYGASGYYLIIYGALFLVIILLLPEGIVPTLRKWWTRWSARHIDDTTAADAEERAVPVTPAQAETGEGVNR